MHALVRADSDSMSLSCRHHFPALDADAQHGIRVFADNSSRAQMPAQTLLAIERQLRERETHRGGNLAWDSQRAADMAALRWRAREAAAAFCGGTAAQIGFAANGTSALAILARAMMGSVVSPGDTIVITEADHDANRAPWETLKRFGCRVIDVPVAADGGLDMPAWQAALAHRPKVVALCMLSNVTGVVLPYQALARQAREQGAVVVLDAVQGPPHGFIDVMSADIDVATFSNCKLFAPHLGWWAIREGLLERMQLTPAVGYHPDLEWGTLAHAGYAGFVATHAYFCDLTVAGDLASAMQAVRRHEATLSERFMERLPASLHGALLAARTPHSRIPIFSIVLERRDWPVVRAAFEAAAIDVRIGQFGCPATLERLSPHTGSAALRLSFVHYNTCEDVDAVCDVLRQLRPPSAHQPRAQRS